jgi:hypothetical protein
MPCSCEGYPVEFTAFGKTYRGHTTQGGDSITRAEIVQDGEAALCRAQKVIVDMAIQSGGLDALSGDLRETVSREIELLHAHRVREGEVGLTVEDVKAGR